MIIIKSFKDRKPWAAALVALFFGGSIGMFYLNQGKKGLVYLLLEYLCLALPFIAFHYDLIKFNPTDMAMIVVILLRFTEIVHCIFVARKFNLDIALKWYARSYNILLVFLILPLIFVYGLRTFLYEPFNVPSASMRPTLEIGEHFMSEKFAYGYGPYSFPLGIGEYILQDKIFAKAPKRGDVVVFRLPNDTSVTFVKRVMGLPKDVIQIKEGKVYINGEVIPQEWAGIKIIYDAQGREFEADIYRETLPNGKTYEIYDTDPDGSVDNTDIYTVPPGHYFMMGDNRDMTRDSRFTDKIGPIPEENITGKAGFIYWNEYTYKIFYKPIN